MASRVNIELIDDLDGGNADETLEFALDGVQYEIDLSSDNAKRLRETFAEFVGHARRTGGRVKGVKGGKRGKGEAAQIRAWAAENDVEVPARGRIPADVESAYRAATGA